MSNHAMTAKAPSTADEQSLRPTAGVASTRPCDSTRSTGPTSRKLCILAAGHDGDHRSGAFSTWPRTQDEPPTGVSLAARADLEVELLADADSGRVELILSDGHRRYEVVDQAEALRAIAVARAQLDRAVGLVTQHQAPKHFPWCDDCEPPTITSSGVLLVDHTSAPVRMPAPAGMETEDQVLLDAVISAGEGTDTAAPQISLGIGDSAAWLDHAAAVKVLADLEAFTAGFRNLVHQMQQDKA